MSKTTKKLIIYSDGAARGNPGPAGAGAYLCKADGTPVGAVSKYLGETTNNVAEYQALIEGLERALSLCADEVELRADSELLVKQVRGEYRVRHPNLQPLYQKVRGLLQKIPRYSINHVRREMNREADRLANEAIDNHFGL